jgi:glycosyltransferase involved in cell wall biosynthesis
VQRIVFTCFLTVREMCVPDSVLVRPTGVPAGSDGPVLSHGGVSIMMPAYNAERFVGEAIESVLAQRYANWELIVVDDGSVDRTPEIVARCAKHDGRITLIRQPNGGEAKARNTALEAMRGEFVAFLDADDVYQPDHLEGMVQYLQSHPQHAGVYTDGYYITEHGQRLTTLSARRRGAMSGLLFDELVRCSDVFGPPLCVVIRRKPIQACRLRFDENIVIGPDWDFFTQFAELGTFGYLDNVSCLYRLHGTNITLRTGVKRRLLELAKCRINAIKRPSFANCPSDVRVAVFYDLLINSFGDAPERQREVIDWPEFSALPEPDRARLLRLMASDAILASGASNDITEWLRRSRSVDPADLRGRLLTALHTYSPLLCRWLLRLRRLGRSAPATHPFADLEARPGATP